jgi:protocatechuate 3,4-dioxygenase beta subunit
MLVLAATGPTTSCRTQPVIDFRSTEVVGTVYDEAGRKVAGAVVRVGSKRGVSDNLGRFRITGVSPGTRTVHAHAPGHEPWHSSVEVRSHATLLHLRLWSVEGLVDEAIMLIDRRAVTAAMEIAARLQACAPEDERTRLLNSWCAAGDSRAGAQHVD